VSKNKILGYHILNTYLNAVLSKKICQRNSKAMLYQNLFSKEKDGASVKISFLAVNEF